MPQHEYYIRQSSAAESRGPFTLKQLSDLAGSGGLDSDTLYFDADTDHWLSITDAPELAALLRKHTRAQSSGPALASRLVIALLIASSVVFLLPLLTVAGSLTVDAILGYPSFWLGALDLLLALCCATFGARFFAVIRIRAGLGLGFLAALFWLQANTGALVAALAATACLWLATVFASARALAANAIAGLAALVALAYCLLP